MTDLDPIIRRLAQLKGLRSPHEKVWSDCFDYSFPIRGSGLNSDRIDATEAQRKKAELVDDTATDAGLILASALMGGMTPANSRWFQLAVQDADDEGEAWLDEAGDLIWRRIHTSDFDAAGLECNLDEVGAGWFVLYVDADEEAGVYRFEQWPIGQCFIASSKRGARIDTIYREFELTAAQARDEYGDDLSPETLKLAVEKPDERVKFLHAIEPRKAWLPGARFARNLPFASWHLELAKKKLVRESGYHEFPCVVPRWRLIPDSHYGVGPMFDALPSARRLNELARMELAAADLAVSGMWIAENDGILNPRTVKVGPKKIIVANSVDSMKPLATGANFEVAWTDQDRLQRQIRKILMADQLQPQDGPAMTATEVHARMALIRQLLGPVYGRLQAEFLQPLIERTFGLAYRARWLGEPPESIAGAPMNIRYVSPLARAQQLEDVSAMNAFETTLIAQAEADPGALDVYRWDDARKKRAELTGVPRALLRSEDEIDELREQKQQAQQDAEQRAIANEGQAAMMTEGAKAMMQPAAA